MGIDFYKPEIIQNLSLKFKKVYWEEPYHREYYLIIF